jgi:CRISPR system Cascade subunit CasB
MDNTEKKEDDFPTTRIFDWWHEMQPANEQEGQRNYRGELAELKRSKSMEEVMLTPRFQVLRRAFLKTERHKDIVACATIAGVLAHVEHNDTKYPFAEWLAMPKVEGGSESRLSELRFRRLIRIETRKDLFAALIRILPLAGDTAQIGTLARDIYYWNERTRREWTFRYYDKLDELPGKASK